MGMLDGIGVVDIGVVDVGVLVQAPQAAMLLGDRMPIPAPAHRNLVAIRPRSATRTPESGTGPPALGAHTDEVLAELGFDSEEIAAFRADGAV